ncbi:NADH-quinone oxidoreductase subunit J [Desnuesiella massiliensis]|uniref:NADH-quinone oxidoreductase subunit J family protein n=1 Tax=Desnuesiella massiliensis TaxID=1650662 RepID=UPI0006E3E670|nr:NADH-quinone oxidoreductase subunit J [Desnuesiella massiliensis]
MVASILFYIISAFIIFAALKMVLSTNLVHSALFMAATFIGIAMIYLLLNADYLAVVQIMVYVGAISILFVFGVMLTKRGDMGESSGFNRYKVYGAFTALAIFLAFARIIISSEFAPVAGTAPESTIMDIASLLLNDYSVAFEIAGILLLVATVGAIVIGKGVKQSK